MKKFISFILILAVLLGGGYFCYKNYFSKTDEEKIRERIEKFEDCYESGDLEGCINCLDTRSKNVYKGIGSLGSLIGGSAGIFSFNLGEDVLKSMFSLGVVTGDEKIKFTIQSISFTDDDNATVKANLWMNADHAFSEVNEDIEFSVVREGNTYKFWENDWYMVEDFSSLLK